MLIHQQCEVIKNCQNKNVLIYAPGGGFGHFTRSLAIAHTFKLLKVTLLVSSTPLSVRYQNSIIVQQIPQTAQIDKTEFQKWFTNVMLLCKPELLIIDTFPAGIKGELNELDLNGTPIVLIARNLKWDVYKRNVHRIRNKIDQIYLIESVNEQYLNFLKTQNSFIGSIDIDDSNETIEPDPGFVKSVSQHAGEKWILVHSGSQDECEELYEYARKIAFMHRVKPGLFLCGNFSRTLQNGTQTIHEIYPVCQYYSMFDRVITGAGFNSVRQAKKYATTYNFYPFERLYDDQYARALRCTNGFIATDGNEVKCAPD